MAVQLPDSASVPRTEAKRCARSRNCSSSAMPQVADTFAVIGFSLLDGGNEEPNGAFLVAKLKPFADRTSKRPIRRRR